MTLDFEKLAREAREQVHPGEAPVDAIIWARRHRAREARIVLASAAAVLVVIGLVVATPWSAPRAPAPPQPARAAFPAPSGLRWVGAGDVVLAVPSSWASSQYGCESDPRPSVVYDPGYWNTCQDTALGRRHRADALWVLPTRKARDGYGGEAFLKARYGMPGLDARRSVPWREKGDIGRYWYQSLVVRSVHTLFVAQATSRAAVKRIISSARHTPERVQVPRVPAGADLAVARSGLRGYDVQVHEVSGYYSAGSVIGSDPDFGTPLRRGDTVVLTVSRGLGPQQAMSDAFLARQGVHIEPLGTISAGDRRRIDGARDRIRARLAASSSPWDTQLVLRRITSKLPSRNGVPEFQHRFAWLALTPRELSEPLLGGPCCHQVSSPAGFGRDISIYDALTGAFVWGTTF